MSRSVRRVLSRTSGGDHLSRTFVAKRLKQPTRRRRAGHPYLLLGLALGGVYQAGSVTQTAGELLPHLFTLIPLTERLFSVTLLPPLGDLPVKKHDALCCPDFPLSPKGQR